MSTLMKEIIFSGFIFFILYQTTNAIQCFVCNGKTDAGCKDPAYLESTLTYLTDCDTLNDIRNVTANYTMCRQTYETWTEDRDNRLLRDCAYEGTVGCMDRIATNAVVEIEVCQCSTDKCNSAGQMIYNKLLLFGSAMPILRLIVFH